ALCSPCSSRHTVLFFCTATATTEIYTLSLHDALPICGVASTVDSVGSASSQMVRATAAGLPTQEFTATAGAPPTSAAVTVSNNSFSPNAVAMQTGSTVTWTWNSGGVTHDVAYDSGPTPLPASSAPQGSGTH